MADETHGVGRGPARRPDTPQGPVEVRGSIGVLGEISVEECLELLKAHDVGRIAVIVDGRPRIFPVNYLLDGEFVVFRTDPGLKLDGAAFASVAFEIDEIDERTHQGWSVAVAGSGREITDALDRASERERALPLVPWAAGRKDHWVRILTPEITGRRLHRVATTGD